MAFLNCATGLVRHYRLLGFRTYAGAASSPRRTASRYRWCCFRPTEITSSRRGPSSPPSSTRSTGRWRRPLDLAPFASLLDADSAPVQLDPAAIRSRVGRLRGAAGATPRMLDALSEETVRKLTDKGFLMNVAAGELLTEKGLSQQEIFVILDGTFEVFDGERRCGSSARGM